MTVERFERIALIFIVAVVCPLIVVLRAHHSTFFQDDLINFEIFKLDGLSTKYFLAKVYGQIVPGYRLADATFIQLFGLSYPAGLAIMTALTAACFAMMVRLLRLAGVAFALVVAAALLIVFQIQTLTLHIWWSAGLHGLPSLFFALAATLLLLRREQATDALAAVVYALGLTFFFKTSAFPAIMFALLFVTSVREGFVRRAGEALYRMRYVIGVTVVYAVLIAIYSDPLPQPAPTRSAILKFLALSFADGTVASLFGLGTGKLILFGSYALTVALALGLLAIGIASSLWIGRTNALVLWLCYGAYVLLAQGPIALSRAGVWGAEGGLSLRYNVETTLLLVLVLALGHARMRFAPRSLAQWAPVAAAIAVCVNLQVWSMRQVEPPYPPLAEVRSYMTNLRAALATLDLDRAVILNEPIPDIIIPRSYVPWCRPEVFLLLFPSPPRVGETGSATHRIAPDGRIVPL